MDVLLRIVIIFTYKFILDLQLKTCFFIIFIMENIIENDCGISISRFLFKILEHREPRQLVVHQVQLLNLVTLFWGKILDNFDEFWQEVGKFIKKASAHINLLFSTNKNVFLKLV